MILGIICFILSLLGIYGFYNELYILTYIAFGFCLFDNVLGRLFGTLKSMKIFFLACIIGFIIVKKFWLGIAIGVCFEEVISFIGGIIYIGFMLILGKKKNREL